MIPLQRLLFSLAAGFWLVAGALALTGVLDLGAGAGARVVAALMLANGAALALAGWLSARGRRLVDATALALVAANAVLSVTDEIGLLDVLSLLVSAALLALLIANLRRRQRGHSLPR